MKFLIRAINNTILHIINRNYDQKLYGFYHYYTGLMM